MEMEMLLDGSIVNGLPSWQNNQKLILKYNNNNIFLLIGISFSLTSLKGFLVKI
jgi:hypothetical protein